MTHTLSLYFQLMRLDKPVGIILLWLPSLWGIMAGARHIQISGQDICFMGFLFLLGSVLMRSAGCVINDYFDRHIDAQVERTKNRPLASGKISSQAGLIFFVLLCLASIPILFALPLFAVILCIISLVPVTLYPLMKRITYWPQIFLGLTFNFGILVGYASVTGYLSWDIMILYLAGIFHTIGYDTVYAFQDIEDDIKIGVKSSAQKVLNSPKMMIAGLYGIFLLCLLWFLYMKEAFLYSYISFVITMIYSLGTIIIWNPHDNTSTLKCFKRACISHLLVLLTVGYNYFS